MLRIAVALGNRSKNLPLLEVRATLQKKYGGEAAVFGVTDRVTRIPDGQTFEQFDKRGIHIKVESFVEEARSRFPQAGVYVGVKSVQMQLYSGEWDFVDYVMIATEGSPLRSISVVGKLGEKVFTGEMREAARHLGVLPEVKTVDAKTPAQFLISLIELNDEQVQKEVAHLPPRRSN